MKCTYVHRMFIRIGIRKIRNIDDSYGSGTKLLLPSLSLGFSTRGERDTIFLCWLFHLTQQMCAHAHLAANNWTGLAQIRKINSPRLALNLKSPLLFKITKNPSPSLPGMTSFTSPVRFAIWGFYCDICDCHIPPRVCVNTCVNVCTYPCTKPKGSQPN